MVFAKAGLIVWHYHRFDCYDRLVFDSSSRLLLAVLLSGPVQMLVGNPSILITDDDRDFRETLRDAFEPRGFQTLLAADGEEALQVVGRERVDLLLLDMHMPRLDGIETVRRLRQRQVVAPCILMSAGLDDALVEQAKQEDFFSSLPKPIPFRLVIDAVRRALKVAYGWGES